MQFVKKNSITSRYCKSSYWKWGLLLNLTGFRLTVLNKNNGDKNMSLNCGCPTQLNDSAGVASLKALYANKGAGGITFFEQVKHNLPVLGLGAGAVLVGAIIYNKKGKGRR
jgi:hypothetical protein